MYILVYHVTTEKDGKVFENEYESEEFRLRRDALHYLRKIVQKDYEEDGYTTEVRVGSIFCYKSKLTEKGERKTEKVLIKIQRT